MMTDRLISEQAVMESLTKEYNQKRTGDGLKLAWIEKAVSATPTASDWDSYSTALWREAYERGKRDGNSTVQPSGWLETHVEEIMQAGYEGREVEFRLNGRAFRIREVPQ